MNVKQWVLERGNQFQVMENFIQIFIWNQGAFQQRAASCQTPVLSWGAAEALK